MSTTPAAVEVLLGFSPLHDIIEVGALTKMHTCDCSEPRKLIVLQ